MKFKKIIRIAKLRMKDIYDELDDESVKKMINSTNKICDNMARELDKTLDLPSPARTDTISGMSNGVMDVLPINKRKRRLGRFVVRKNNVNKRFDEKHKT